MADNTQKTVVKMSELELLRHIKMLAKVSTNVVILDHAQIRMKQRRISAEDVSNVLRLGTMSRPPEPGDDPNEMKCRINGRDLDNKSIGIEVAVSDDNPCLLVITVIR